MQYPTHAQEAHLSDVLISTDSSAKAVRGLAYATPFPALCCVLCQLQRSPFADQSPAKRGWTR